MREGLFRFLRSPGRNHGRGATAVPVRRAAGQRDRAALAGALGTGGDLPRGQPVRRAVRRRLPAAEAGRPKFYLLDFFPYPSGIGLHVGHPLGYIGTDVFGRYLRMTGHHVLHPFGFDTFGLPAEQYAIDTGQHPAVTVRQNAAVMRRQLRRLGLAHDHRREILTSDPSYYRWTQWIFLRIFGSWYDPDAGPVLGRARPISDLVGRVRRGPPPHPGRTAVAGPDRGGAAGHHRRSPAGVPVGAGRQLVPGTGHRAGRRGGDRRETQRGRQLPGAPQAAAPVDAAHHRVSPNGCWPAWTSWTGRSGSSACSGTGSGRAAARTT